MNWFRVDTTLVDHPKVIRFGEMAGVTTEAAIGRIVRFFSGVAMHAEDGDLTNIPAGAIAAWVRWKKKPDSLLQLLVDCGFIDEEGGSRRVHGWSRRHDYMIRERTRKIAAESERKDRARKAREAKQDAGAPNARQVDDDSARGKRASTPLRSPSENDVVPSEQRRPDGSLFPAEPPKPESPKKRQAHSDVEKAKVAFTDQYQARYGRECSVTDHGKIGKQIQTCLTGSSVEELSGLVPLYFDLAAEDQFHEGAPPEKFFMGATLNKLRARRDRPSEPRLSPNEAAFIKAVVTGKTEARP